MSEGAVKGSVLQSRIAFLRERGGPDGFARVIESLPDADRQIIGDILAVGWYPFALNERLDFAIARELGQGDRVFKTLGEVSARDNLSNSHRAFIRSRDPHGLLKQAASIYRLYYNTGHRTYARLGDTRAVLSTRESKTFSRADCLTVIGWHEKAIEMCGGQRPRVTETACRARGDATCDYTCDWK